MEIQEYQALVHDFKTAHSIKDGQTSGISCDEIAQMMMIIDIFSLSGDKDKVEFAKKQLDYINRLKKDPKNNENLYAELTVNNMNLKKEEELFKKLPNKSLWASIKRKFGSKDPDNYTNDQLSALERIATLKKEKALLERNVIAYTTILEHNAQNDFGY